MFQFQLFQNCESYYQYLGKKSLLPSLFWRLHMCTTNCASIGLEANLQTSAFSTYFSEWTKVSLLSSRPICPFGGEAVERDCNTCFDNQLEKINGALFCNSVWQNRHTFCDAILCVICEISSNIELPPHSPIHNIVHKLTQQNVATKLNLPPSLCLSIYLF